jgi:hypothetical protein
MMILLLTSLTLSFLGMMVLAFYLGQRNARLSSFQSLVTWGAMARRGHPDWSGLAVGDALVLAAALISGQDFVKKRLDPVCRPRTHAVELARRPDWWKKAVAAKPPAQVNGEGVVVPGFLLEGRQ